MRPRILLCLAIAGCGSTAALEPPAVPTVDDACVVEVGHRPGDLQLLGVHVEERDGRVIVESPDVEEGERYVAIDNRGWAGLVAIDEPAPFHCHDCRSHGSWAHWVARLPCAPVPTMLAGPTATDWPKARALSGLDNLRRESCPPRPPPNEPDGETGLISTMSDPGPRLGPQWLTDIQLDLDGDGRADLEGRVRACLGQPVGLYPRVAMEWRAHDGNGWRVTDRFFVPDWHQ